MKKVATVSPFFRVSSLARLIGSRDGSVVPFAAFVFLVLIGTMGFAIDAGRLFLLHSSLQRALDAGALSAVVKMSTEDVETQLKQFATVNFDKGYVGGTIDAISYSWDDSETTLTATGTATRPRPSCIYSALKR